MDSSMPALYGHCLDVYKTMKDQGHPDVIEDREVIIYTGYLTKLFAKELSLPMPYYSKVMGMLHNMDCVRQLRRGGGGQPSQWALIQQPTEELFNAKQEEHPPTRQKQGKAQEMQMIRDLQKRMDIMEKLHQDELAAMTL